MDLLIFFTCILRRSSSRSRSPVLSNLDYDDDDDDYDSDHHHLHHSGHHDDHLLACLRANSSGGGCDKSVSSEFSADLTNNRLIYDKNMID